MATLEKRIEALEQAGSTNTDMVMFIHLVAFGEADKEIQRITHGGHEWKRQPTESEQDFKDRARQEAPGCLTFFCFC